MLDTQTADLILRELTAPKQRGVHYSPDSAAQLLAEYRDQVARDLLATVREQVAQKIEAEMARNLAEYPEIPAMRARRLGLAHAARIARTANTES